MSDPLARWPKLAAGLAAKKRNMSCDDARWLRERAEDLVRYEEDAQRLRRIADALDASGGCNE